MAAPADVYAATPGTQTAAISSLSGNGGFENLTFNPAAVSTTVTEVTDTTTVTLTATGSAAEGGTITYTADLGANAAQSDITVNLDNGQSITILAGATSGSVTVAAPSIMEYRLFSPQYPAARMSGSTVCSANRAFSCSRDMISLTR